MPAKQDWDAHEAAHRRMSGWEARRPRILAHITMYVAWANASACMAASTSSRVTEVIPSESGEV
jgi:hypothetical protein